MVFPLLFFQSSLGSGKSVVVELLINHHDTKSHQTINSDFPSPVPGSVNDNLPVSTNVHLYADPDFYMTDAPVLYADCERLGSGEATTKATVFKLKDGITRSHHCEGSLERTTRIRM